MIQVKKKYAGQQSTAALNGQIRLEEGNNRFVVRDVATGAMIVFGAMQDGFGSAYYNAAGALVKTETGSLSTWYDASGRVIKIDGIIPSLANYPVTIIAQHGQDVYADILGIPRP